MARNMDDIDILMLLIDLEIERVELRHDSALFKFTIDIDIVC